jgi:ribokinase
MNMDLVATASRLPLAGETIVGDEFHTAPGGKGANQAVAAVRLGAEVRMVGRVGDDAFGRVLKDGLESHGVDVSRVAVDSGSPSGTAIILLDAERENHIVAVYGANMRCDETQVLDAESALNDADCLLLQLEIPLEVSLAAARIARELGVRVVLDPAPASELPSEAYATVDVLTPNQTEAETLTGLPVADADSARVTGEELCRRGVETAIVKLGEQGAVCVSGESSGHVPGYEVKVADTVAAGDAFGGALGVALAERRSLEDAVRFGSAAGALAVTRPGAQEAMPGRAEVERLVG